LPISALAVIFMPIIPGPVRIMAVAISIDRPPTGRRSHEDGRWAIARCHHDSRGVSKNHPRKWRQRNANVNVDTCLGSRSRSEKNRCDQC
jgi:hypothetical protein